ncbi:MAG: hypothetical protein K6G90_03615 [Clostridia bacterium]|nr:hypothetical protein [Clostridia bacterium]
MKKTKKIFCMILSLLLTVGVLTPAVAGAQDGEDLTEMFGYDLFSDETVNGFLSVIMGFSEVFEYVAEDTFRQMEFSIREAINSVDNVSCSGAKVYFNGEEGTGLIRDIFAPIGMRIYPDSLAAFIADQGDNGLNSIIYALRTRGQNWTEADLTDGFDFDWGIDALADPDARYERFARVLGMLIDGTGIFKIMLMGDEFCGPFSGNVDFLHIIVEKLKYKLGIIEAPVGSLIFSDISGYLRISGGNAYSGYILPVYRALGLGTALQYSFAQVTNYSMPGYRIVRAIYDPLMYLADTVRSNPGACRSLMDFYASGAGRSCVNQIPDSNTLTLNIRFDIDDGKVAGYEGSSLSGSIISSILEMFSAHIIDLLRECILETHVEYSPFGEDGNMKEYLAEALPALTYTEPGQPTEETSEPTGEDPTEPAAGDENGQEESIWQKFISRITSIFRIISDWFRKLFGGR